MILEIIVSALVSLLTAGGGVLFLRAKYRAEVEKLKTENRNAEVSLLANSTETLINNIVKPLEHELSKVRKMAGGLQKALQKVYDCPYIIDCPVRKQLHSEEKNIGSGDHTP